MARKTKEEAQLTRQQIIDAARAVFHESGVSRSSLDAVARVAGVTRGAVYWHFKDKTELFHAVREEVSSPLLARSHAILDSGDYADPLDAVEAAIVDFFRILEDCPTLRQVVEIMVLRCEYVDEFVDVKAEVMKPAFEFNDRVAAAYRRAAAAGTLRPGLDPESTARDTLAFTTGLMHLLIGAQDRSGMREQVPAMIAAHMALRRRGDSMIHTVPV